MAPFTPLIPKILMVRELKLEVPPPPKSGLFHAKSWQNYKGNGLNFEVNFVLAITF